LTYTQAIVDQVTQPDTPATWATVVAPLDTATEQLSRMWGAIEHMNAVVDTPELRAAYQAMLPQVTQFWAELGQNEALFKQYQAIAQSAAFAMLTSAQRTVIQHALRDFKLGGAELPAEHKPRFADIQAQQAELSNQFSEHILDTMNAFQHLVTDEAHLVGLPDDAIAAASALAHKHQQKGWLFTLHMPSYLPVMQYADHRDLRETLYRAYATRASELADHPAIDTAALDNSALMVKLLQLRQEEAQLLGYENFASVSLVPKMAESTDQVIQFLRDLAQRARPFALADVTQLRQFATDHLNLPDLHAWDMAYASEKLRQANYAFSDHELKQYFPEDKVLQGLFHIIEQLYSVHIQPTDGSVWHTDARLFTITNQQQQPIAQFYIDLYARTGKRGGAWMDVCRSRKRRDDGTIQIPVAYLVCNFSPPAHSDTQSNQPALFTHDEVITLFHEFGHGLHHMLTQVEELGVSGISGVAWDAVELPSQFMENFCWEWDVLQGLTRHVESGEPLPRALFDKMIAAKNFQIGMQTLRQIEFSLFDLLLHMHGQIESPQMIQSIVDQVRQDVAVVTPPAFNRFQHSFSHIFSGGYAAGYYSYKWAEVLSADVYAAFEEERAMGQVFNPATGERFLREILSVGGSRDAMTAFIAFRGRTPHIEALLRHHGMSPNDSTPTVNAA
jgi:oligopeptidase A